MELIIIAGALTLAGGVLAGIGTRRLRDARRLSRDAREALELANDALGIGQPMVVASGVIPGDSPEGRALMAVFRQAECGCPNCEEERRIAHAEQKRDER